MRISDVWRKVTRGFFYWKCLLLEDEKLGTNYKGVKHEYQSNGKKQDNKWLRKLIESNVRNKTTNVIQIARRRRLTRFTNTHCSSSQNKRERKWWFFNPPNWAHILEQ